MKSDSDPIYKPKEIAKKWQERWAQTKLYTPDMDKAQKPYYVLMMFPYPSAEGLHIGSIYAYTGADTFARFKRMQGYDVFHPMGLDSFGIHSENYALKIGKHPMDQAKIAEENFYRQLQSTGNSYDWTRKLETSDIDYYRWTQWLFIELFKAGLAYRKKSPVNFCPSCKTVLADEQVIDGKCERCESVVEKRDLEQWFFRITDYAERLLENIPALNWAEKVKNAQHNWIGKKEGAKISFQIKSGGLTIDVFTTRPDTLYGVTALILSPEHPLLNDIKFISQIADKDSLNKYIKEHTKLSLTPEEEAKKEKTGIDTGISAIHPLTGEPVPIWVSDYVLMGYGTGAIMAVPAHDERDFAFAQKLGITIKQVIAKDGFERNLSEAYVGDGFLINSDEWNGFQVPKDMSKVFEALSAKGIGERQVNYHLRDWLISRQRYWGPPIPMIYCEDCAKQGKSWFTEENNEKKTKHSNEMNGWFPEQDLPVELPYIQDYRPLGTGASPLGNHTEFYETTCPGCGGKAKRETDVTDVFLDSAWYFLRYTSTDIENEAFDTDRVKKWLPTQMYIGGAEHSVLHLLYARFITHVLKDLGYVQFKEPFARFFANGLIIKDGAKMSKSKGNVILPDPLIDKFGIDTVRMYLRFIGPFSEGGDFRDTGIEGMHRFVKRVWTLLRSVVDSKSTQQSPEQLYMLHTTIKGVTEDMEELRFNTAIAKLMEYYNFVSRDKQLDKESAKVFLKLLSPFAPHMTEELWEQMGEAYSIHTSPWPIWDETYLAPRSVTVAIQINRKVRDTLELESNDPALGDKDAIEGRAKMAKNVATHLQGKVIKKTIYIPKKIINFVI